MAQNIMMLIGKVDKFYITKYDQIYIYTSCSTCPIMQGGIHIEIKNEITVGHYYIFVYISNGLVIIQ